MTCAQMEVQHKTTVVAGSATGYTTSYSVLPCVDVAGQAIYTIQAGYAFPPSHKSIDDFKATPISSVVGTIICTAEATIS